MTKQELFDKVDNYKNRINALRPFSPEQEIIVDKLHREKFSDYQKLTEDNILINSDTDVYDYLLLQAGADKLDITEDTIKHIHFLIYSELDQGEAGHYRKKPSNISAAGYIPPDSEDVPRLMEHFINQMQNSRRMMHPIEYATMCHKRFIDIQPFNVGNDTLALLLLNLILINEGYGVTVISQESYGTYKHALTLSRRKINPDIDKLTSLIAVYLNPRRTIADH